MIFVKFKLKVKIYLSFSGDAEGAISILGSFGEIQRGDYILRGSDEGSQTSGTVRL